MSLAWKHCLLLVVQCHWTTRSVLPLFLLTVVQLLDHQEHFDCMYGILVYHYGSPVEPDLVQG